MRPGIRHRIQRDFKDYPELMSYLLEHPKSKLGHWKDVIKGMIEKTFRSIIDYLGR